MSKAPLLPLRRPDGGGSEPAEENVPLKKLNARTLADAAEQLSRQLSDPAVAKIAGCFAKITRDFAANPKHWRTKARLKETGRSLDMVSHHTAEAADIQDILVSAEYVMDLSPASVLAGYHRLQEQKKTVEPTMGRLRIQAQNFCDFAADSTLADAAIDFRRAVEKNASGNDRKKRVVETDLHKAGVRLFQDATRAPATEAALSDIAHKMAQDSDIILLSPDDSKSPDFLTSLCDLRRGCSGCCSSFFRWIRSGPELTLPVHHKRKEKLVDKRKVLFGIALATPLPFLISAAAQEVFPSELAPWIAGTTVFVWIVVSGGMVSNLYGTTHLELIAAVGLSRIGILSACALISFYTFFAFFPHHSGFLWFLLFCAVSIHGGCCILNHCRGDDDPLASIQNAEEMESISSTEEQV